jgi:hypothetical protein
MLVELFIKREHVTFGFACSSLDSTFAYLLTRFSKNKFVCLGGK